MAGGWVDYECTYTHTHARANIQTTTTYFWPIRGWTANRAHDRVLTLAWEPFGIRGHGAVQHLQQGIVGKLLINDWRNCQ